MEKMTIHKLSMLTGKDRRFVQKRLENIEPIDKKGVAEFYDSVEALEEIYSNGGCDSAQRYDLQKERARLTYEQANAKELENEIARGEVAPVEVIAEVLQNISQQIKSTLEAIPLKLKQRNPSLTATDLQIITKEIVKAQNAASEIQFKEEDTAEAG